VSLKPLFLPAGLLVAAVAALTGGAIAERFGLRQETGTAQLRIITDLKTRQVADWLREREDDARYLATSPYFAESYRHWRFDGTPARRDALRTRLDQFGKTNAFHGVALLDERGVMLWNSLGFTLETDPALLAAALQAAAARQVRRIGPYLDAASQPHLDFVVPLVLAGDPPPVVVLHADPEKSLFPLLQEWPAPSASGETLLFRRDGDHVTFLNRFRHRTDTALRFSAPVAGSNLLAARLLRGEVAVDSLGGC